MGEQIPPTVTLNSHGHDGVWLSTLTFWAANVSTYCVSITIHDEYYSSVRYLTEWERRAIIEALGGKA